MSAFAFVLSAVAAEAPGPGPINARGDAGAAVLPAAGTAAVIALGAEKPPEALALHLAARTHALGGGIRGFGVLARFAAPGPGQVWISRATRVPGREPYAPIALVRIIDPTGRTVAVHEASDQADGAAAVLITVPPGPAGIWRVSCTGGRQGDHWQAALPPSPAWGIRGEMSLAWEQAPVTAWLWVPPTARTLLVEQFDGTGGALALRDEQGAELARCGTRERHGTRQVALLEPAPAGSVVAIDLAAAPGAALLVDGAPGLLCPTAEAARDLAGGTVQAAGLTTAGPLQARAREWMAHQTPADLAVPAGACRPGDGAEDEPSEALLYGKYGPFTGIAGFIERQRLDARDPFCGTEIVPKPGDGAWDAFVYGPLAAPFQANGLATLATLPAKRNPLHGNQAIIRRAVLAAFHHLSSLTGDDLARENPLWNRADSYPVIHSFFVYEGSIASPYALLAGHLDPEARAIWRDGVIAMGDRLADHQGYQTNQWAHVLLAHLQTYRATGEKRFLGYFTRMAAALIDGAWGPDSKFGQHPAGFYLEEYGCDGNYDNMDLAALARIWRLFRELPEADQALADRLRASIERNLRFRSLLWLPLAGGAGLATPTSFNSRRPESTLAHSNPLGEYLLADELPLAATRVRLIPEPVNGAGNAATFPYIATSPTWAKRLMERPPEAVTPAWIGGDGAMWEARAKRGHARTAAVEPAAVPAAGPDGLWELPGLVAWKRAGLYGVVFHDVAGATPKTPLKGIMGGGPTGLWQPATGPLVLSMATPAKADPAAPLSSVVFGTTGAGAAWRSGGERSTLAWTEPGREFTVTADPAGIGGALVWRYRLDADALRISVSLKSGGAASATVNLPLYAGAGAPAIETPAADRVVCTSAAGRVEFATGGAPATVSEAMPTATAEIQVRCLRLPLPVDGTPVTITVSVPP